MSKLVIIIFFFANIFDLVAPLLAAKVQNRIDLPRFLNVKHEDYTQGPAQNIVPDILRDAVLRFNSPHEILDRVSSVLESSNGTCFEDLSQLLAQVDKLVRPGQGIPAQWALQMVDAWGKFPSGLLKGNLGDPGDFWECLNLRGDYIPARLNESVEIRGKYCKSSITLTNGLTLGGDFSTMGICYPASCSEAEIQFALSKFSEAASGLVIQTVVSSCVTAEKPPLDAGDYTMIIILSVIAGICVVATVVDLILEKLQKNQEQPAPPGLPLKLLLSFSLYTNTRKWLSTNAGSDNFGCLHGIRFLSISWVVLCHTNEMIAFNVGTANLADVLQWYKDWSVYPILNGTLAVDTFFCMSGALMAYNLLRELDKTKGKFNYPLLVLHRFLRLTPTYIFVIGIMATLFPYIATGPNGYRIDQLSADCEKNWWHNLLYINNLIDYTGTGSAMCYDESWYLANDMQFFLLAPAVIYPLWRWKKIGYGLLTVLSLLSVISAPIIMHVKHLPPTYSPFQNPKTYLPDIYQKPWTRCGPYIVGLILGYILHLRQKHPQKFTNIPAPVVLTGWALSTAFGLAIIYGPMKLFYPENQELAETAWYGFLYGAVHRYVWGVVIAWVIFACVNGNGGIVNDFLSWKVFIPLGRLTFCMYISSNRLQMVYHTSQIIHPVYLSYYAMTYWYFAHLVASGFLAFLLMITLESPFIQLERLLLSPSRATKPGGKPTAIVGQAGAENPANTGKAMPEPASDINGNVGSGSSNSKTIDNAV